MTAASFPLPSGVSKQKDHNPALARKRRREILMSQRALSNENEPSPTLKIMAAEEEEEKQQEQKPFLIPSSQINTSDTDTDSSSQPANKKSRTQMRYEPVVPMTKEETAAWRREARRVRNRESAAASRRRTRDRINVLESEVSHWKLKYGQAVERLEFLQRLEEKECNSKKLPFDDTMSALLDAVTKEIQSVGYAQVPTVIPDARPVPACDKMDTNEEMASTV